MRTCRARRAVILFLNNATPREFRNAKNRASMTSDKPVQTEGYCVQFLNKCNGDYSFRVPGVFVTFCATKS